MVYNYSLVFFLVDYDFLPLVLALLHANICDLGNCAYPNGTVAFFSGAFVLRNLGFWAGYSIEKHEATTILIVCCRGAMLRDLIYFCPGWVASYVALIDLKLGLLAEQQQRGSSGLIAFRSAHSELGTVKCTQVNDGVVRFCRSCHLSAFDVSHPKITETEHVAFYTVLRIGIFQVALVLTGCSLLCVICFKFSKLNVMHCLFL